MADKEFKFVKLNENNYTIWKFGVSIALGSAGLMGYIDGTEAEPDKTKELDKWKKWKSDSLKAMSIIVGSVEMRLHTYLINCSNPKETWKKLRQRFGEISEDAKQSAWQKFYDFRIIDGKSIAQQLEDFQCICKQLADTGDKPSETAVQSKILCSLPVRFSPFHMAWECTPEAERKSDKLISRLIREDKRLCETEESASSLALQTQALSSKKDDNQPGKSKKFDHKKRIENLKKKTKCAVCKEKGHWARECPNKSSNNHSQQPTASSYTAEAYVSDVSVFYLKTNDSDEDIWLADSGASMHMTYRRDFFSTLDTLDETRYVKIADDKVLPAAGKGTIVIHEKVLEKTTIRELKNVLFVPELRRNLFSIGTINGKNFSFHSYQTYCKVRDTNGQLTSRGVRHGKLFKMHFEIEIPVKCNVVESQQNKLKLWHERFGHVNIRAVINTSKALADSDFNVEKLNDFFCETCVMGKQTRKPHPSANIASSFKPGEKIHTDVCGPINVESPKGSRYFLLFKDECTSYRKIYFLRHKSEVFDRFKDYENFVQTQTGNKIKVIRSDNGREYISEQFRKHTIDRGIVHEFSSPYIHEQNGRAEREMRTIVESARTMLINNEINPQLWPEAVNTACYLLNRVLMNNEEQKTPFERFFGRRPEVKHLRVFGIDTYLNMPKEKRRKLDPKSKKLIFVGYEGESRNYRLWDKETRKIYVSSDVDFNERNQERKEPHVYRCKLDFGLQEEHEETTAEAEYIALTHGTKEAIWLRQMFDELAIPIESVPMFVDNQSAIKLASNTEFHKRSKHIDVRFHFVCDVISRKEIEIHYVQSKQQLADIFTKPLPAQQFCFLRERINMSDDSK